MAVEKIPAYPESRRIALGDKPLFHEAFVKMQPRISEFTFTNLYLWGQAKDYKVSMMEGHILVFFEEDGIRNFFSPIGPDPVKLIMRIFSDSKGGLVFTRVPEKVAKGVSGPRIEVIEDPSNFDYVYNRADLAELKGAKYYPKRSFAEKAMEYNPIISDHMTIGIEKFENLERHWCELQGCDHNKALGEEAQAIYGLFAKKKSLGVMCLGIMVDGRLAAFAAAEELNKETYVVHFEKADTDFKGMYQLINRELAKLVPEGYKYINREQDLGIEGIRKAKQSYHPAMMVKKFRISRSS